MTLNVTWDRDSFLGVLILHHIYRDSAALMGVSNDIESQPHIQRAGVMMATPANLAILANARLMPKGAKTRPDDLVIAVRASGEEAAVSALKAAERSLSEDGAPATSGKSGDGGAAAPATVAEAVAGLAAQGRTPGLVSVSVPGTYAPIVVEQSLRRDLDVFCFSDNVAVADEVRLKRLAAERGRLLMGPDCGTAWSEGRPLGFANAWRRGPVGIVAASGTGAQEVACLLDRGGVGISQLIGVGGRDLSAEVGGAMTWVALDRLAADSETSTIVVVSKPSDQATADRLQDRVRALCDTGLAGVVCLIGAADQGAPGPGRLAVRGTLEGTALAVLACHNATWRPATAKVIGPLPSAPGILGLYTGGTLAAEAAFLLKLAGVAAEIIDLGDDQYTAGKPHPMIDPSGRAARLVAAADDPAVGLVLGDLVLGHGAAADPASPWAKAATAASDRAAASGRRLVVVTAVTGTTRDPQGYLRQLDILSNAGIRTADSHAGAVRLAAQMVQEVQGGAA